MRRAVALRPEAQRDIAEIWTYTEERWGEEQAELYTDQLRARIHTIADNPDMGSDCSDIHPDLRRIRCGAHLVYYLATDALLDVVRILHERRDATALL